MTRSLPVAYICSRTNGGCTTQQECCPLAWTSCLRWWTACLEKATKQSPRCALWVPDSALWPSLRGASLSYLLISKLSPAAWLLSSLMHEELEIGYHSIAVLDKLCLAYIQIQTIHKDLRPATMGTLSWAPWAGHPELGYQCKSCGLVEIDFTQRSSRRTIQTSKIYYPTLWTEHYYWRGMRFYPISMWAINQCTPMGCRLHDCNHDSADDRRLFTVHVQSGVVIVGKSRLLSSRRYLPLGPLFSAGEGKLGLHTHAIPQPEGPRKLVWRLHPSLDHPSAAPHLPRPPV